MSWIRMTLALLLLASTATTEVVPLTDATFAENVNSADSLWFIKFYADWCPWSQRLAPAWEQLGADEEVRQAGVRIGAVDCIANKATCLRLVVPGYPTMSFFVNGEKFNGLKFDEDSYYSNYFGERDLESMKAFALEMLATLEPLKLTAATAGLNSTRE